MKVLIVGLGSIGRKHAKVLQELYSDICIYALRTDNKDRVSGIENIHSYEAMPSDIDFIIVSNPTIYHLETIRQVIEFKKPIFIEKPAFHKIDSEVYRIKEYLSQHGIFTYTGCPIRFHPCITFIKEFLASSSVKINEVSVYCGSFLPDWRPGVDFRKIYSANEALGGGVHLDLIHEIDYVYYLFGKPVSVTSLLKSQSSLGIKSTDYAHFVLDYCDFATTITLNYFRPIPKRSIEIVFSDNIWHIDLINGEIVDKGGQLIFKEKVDQIGLLKKQMNAFINAIEEGKKSPNTIEESIEVLKICLNQS